MALPPDLPALLDLQRGLVSTAQLQAHGVSTSVVRRRLRREWRLALPRVVQVFAGELDPAQRMLAAHLYAGPGSVVASLAAAAWHGVTAASGDVRVHVEVPVPRGPRGAGFVVVRRTTRPDDRAWQRGAVRITSPARAVAAAAADAGDRERCGAVVLEAVQRGICTVAALRHELECGPRAGSAAPRAALREAEAGAWSVPEADLLRVLATSPTLPAVWPNPEVRAADGTRLPRPDAWLDDVALAVQVHSRRYHSEPADWDRTVMADGVFAEYGVVVVGVTPAMISRSPLTVRQRIERAYASARTRPRPPVTARPVAGR